MKVADISLDQLRKAEWNPNLIDEAMLERLRVNIKRYDVVQNLVVRPIGNNTYEVLSGNQRLKILRELGMEMAPCMIINLDDAQARLLSQALNHIRGEDALGLRAELMRKVIATIPEEDILATLPETADSLRQLASLGQDTIAAYLQNWQIAQMARLKHLQFQLTPNQFEIVEEALARVLSVAKQEQGSSPNTRGTGLYLLARFYLEKGELE